MSYDTISLYYYSVLFFAGDELSLLSLLQSNPVIAQPLDHSQNVHLTEVTQFCYYQFYSHHTHRYKPVDTITTHKISIRKTCFIHSMISEKMKAVRNSVLTPSGYQRSMK
ncbi:hypothetical protein RF11_11688 [Thelohanellus kitauei]|uniref:Uncharacterized protein n=1 Tax=Thelohanellus kitauei TaxID=669202 RepID=A0A0C2IAJ4_THEKT|nr:hypothetical protein RF11_11688 [Thelohanellus kitauei]